MTVEEAAVDGGVGRKRVILTDVDEEDESVSKFWSVEDFVAKVSTDEFVNSWVRDEMDDDDERPAAEYFSVECLEADDDSDKIAEAEAIENILDSSLSYDMVENTNRDDVEWF